MKNKWNLKAILCASCTVVMLVSVMPASARAMDTSYFDQMAAWQTSWQAQMDARFQEQQDAVSAVFFDVDAAFRHIMSLPTNAKREEYFFSLTEAERGRLIDYLGKMAEEGKFTGFYDGDTGLVDALLGRNQDAENAEDEDARTLKEHLQAGASEKKTETAVATDSETLAEAAEKETEKKEKKKPLTKEEQLIADYMNQFELYLQYGSFADLSGIPFEVSEEIRALVDSGQVVKDDMFGLHIVSRAEEHEEKEAEVPADEPSPQPVEPVVPAPVPEEEDLEKEETGEDWESSPYLIPDETKHVFITTTLGKSVKPGDLITLQSHLEGFDNCHDVVYIWSVDKGNGFEDVPDSNAPSYSFPATAETLSWKWHLEVRYR